METSVMNIEKKGDHWMKKYFKTIEDLIKLQSIHSKTLYELEDTKCELGYKEREIKRLKSKLKEYEWAFIIAGFIFIGLIILSNYRQM